MNRETDGKRVIVLGGTGYLGRRVVKSLIDLGAKPRVLTRNIEAARNILGEEVEIVEGELLDKESLQEALKGCDAMGVCISAFSRKLIRHLRAIEVDGVTSAFRAAEAAGVNRVVYLSVYQPDHPLSKKLNMVMGQLKQEVEAALHNSNLNWTVLGAPPSMEIFFAFIRGQKMMVPGGGPPGLPTISSTDVGAIMAEALLRDDLNKQRFRLTGPDPLSFPEAARRIGAVWGKEIRFKKIPLFIPRLVAAIIGPFIPFIKHVVASLRLLNAFPEDLVKQIPKDHQRLQKTFSYTPRTLEDEAKAQR